ncbi:hypothetical protein Bca101_043034 [Brassica carinata]
MTMIPPRRQLAISLICLIFEGSNFVVLSASVHCLRYVGISFCCRGSKKSLKRQQWPVWVILQDMSSNFD